MKTKLLFITIILSLSAYGTQKDSISYGASYANDVYYSMKNGEVKIEPRTNWDIAFTTSMMSASILTNGGAGVELYSYPKGDTSAWSTLDTSGIYSWNNMVNSETDWDKGAFNVYSTNHPDYGWGKYNAITHDVVGDSIFVIKLIDGTYKKIWIIKKHSVLNTFTFRIANIDGSSDTTITLNCNNYNTKNFIYYSVTNKNIIDREPSSNTWDIVFTKYMASQPSGGYYSVTGVLQNNKVAVAQADSVDTATVNWGPYSMDLDISKIGWDWKTFSMTTFTYKTKDSLVYFVKSLDSNIYKLVFTKFDGSSTGNVYFTKSLLSTVDIQKPFDESKFSLFPNPANEGFTIKFSDNFDTQKQLCIYDISGKIVYKNIENGSETYINISDFEPGIYFVSVKNGSKIYVKKLIVK